MFCASYHPQKNRSVTVLELPFLPIPNGEVQKAADLAVYNHPYTKKEMARWNAMLLMSAPCPSMSSWAAARLRARYRTSRACGCARWAASAKPWR